MFRLGSISIHANPIQPPPRQSNFSSFLFFSFFNYPTLLLLRHLPASYYCSFFQFPIIQKKRERKFHFSSSLFKASSSITKQNENPSQIRMRTTNHLIGLLNFLTFLLSVPILAGGIWLSSRANSTECLRFLQWPLIIIGISIMVVSLAGFAGACYRNTFLMWLYLFVMFFVIAVLLGFIIFAYVVTDRGSGRTVPGRAYLDYRIQDFNGWLKDRVQEDNYWVKISSCIRDSKVCGKMGRFVGGVPESADMFFLRQLSPVESGCCKPPSDCGSIYQNETFWFGTEGMTFTNRDCTMWSNDQSQLCYSCGSCKAGVLATLKKSWRKVSIINIVVLIILVIVYLIGIAAFRNNRRIDNDEPSGEARMEKARPSWIHS